MDKDSNNSIRYRMTRNTRALTPDPMRIERASKSSDRDIKSQSQPVAVGGDVIHESKYVVRGILNVGPPSPSGSNSSSSSNSGERSGSHAYRAKLMRYLHI
jgi:hypothetical protein